jgi:hypothetical protein
VLEAIRWHHRPSGQEVRQLIRHLFLFIGAEPNTEWLSQYGVALDDKGFVRTYANVGGAADRSTRVAPASLQSVMFAPDRSSGSLLRSGRAPKWWQRFTDAPVRLAGPRGDIQWLGCEACLRGVGLESATWAAYRISLDVESALGIALTGESECWCWRSSSCWLRRRSFWSAGEL